MISKSEAPFPRFGWYPRGNSWEVQRELEKHVTLQWLQEHLSLPAAQEWSQVFSTSRKLSAEHLLSGMNHRHTPELVELLYPRTPELF